jgi:aldose 1-epimerase
MNKKREVFMANEAYKDKYLDEKAIWLKTDKYIAAVLPNIGGNLVAFREPAKGYRFLHEPTEQEWESFKGRPMIHGIPVLFPPNRYEDGKFTLNGREYRFPVNEARTGNHLHGFFYNIPWTVTNFSANEQESTVTLFQDVDERHSAYEHFPHRFTMTLTYSLSDKEGLVQHIAIVNRGAEAMPCMVAFHTAVNAPFAPGSTARDCRFKATIGKRWELNERMLPTGKFQEMGEAEKKIQGEGQYPFFESMDNHYTSEPQNGRNFMTLTDEKAGARLVYEVGFGYKQWMIWNNGAQEGFFCPEPQVNLVNAPNVDVPADLSGLLQLAPGETWAETSRLYSEVLA